MLSTITNNYIEIFQREISKPEFKKTINYILNSNTNNKIFILTKYKIHQEIVSNYTKAIISNQNVTLNFLEEIKENDINTFWTLCYEPLNQFQCIPTKIEIDNFTKQDEIRLKLINATLYKRNL